MTTPIAMTMIAHFVTEMISMKLEKTLREFAVARFRDRYNEECSIQKSSLAEQDCIWLGVHEKRMHLTQAQVAELLPLLQHFVETGDLIDYGSD